jgi:hypothetical protein
LRRSVNRSLGNAEHDSDNLLQAGYLFSVKAGVSLALYAAIIPSFLQLLMKKFSYSSTHANLVGLWWSLVILCGGAILMALSVELWMLIIGT